MPHKHRHINKKHQDGHSRVSKYSRSSKHKHDASILDQFRSKLRFIESLRGRYAGREIWVLATGSSLDDIPEDFLKMAALKNFYKNIVPGGLLVLNSYGKMEIGGGETRAVDDFFGKLGVHMRRLPFSFSPCYLEKGG